MKQILQTDRLLLRELDSADLAFLFDLLSDPDVMRFWPNPLTKEECNDWLQRQRVRYEERGYGYWLAINKALGEPLGQAGVLQIEVDHRSETALGYIIGKAYWNRGYATEAAAGCLEYAFETLEVSRVIAPIRPGNTPSERVAVKLGMLPERTVPFAGFTHSIYIVTRDAFLNAKRTNRCRDGRSFAVARRRPAPLSASISPCDPVLTMSEIWQRFVTTFGDAEAAAVAFLIAIGGVVASVAVFVRCGRPCRRVGCCSRSLHP